MPQRPLNTLKTYFETGDKPTQAHFWDWLESFWHKDDSIPIASVSGLSDTLNTYATEADLNAFKAVDLTVLAPNTTASINIPAGSILQKLRVKSTSAVTFKLGTTVGGGEILDSESLGANQVGIYNVDFDSENLTTLHLSSLAGTTNIKFYILQ